MLHSRRLFWHSCYFYLQGYLSQWTATHCSCLQRGDICCKIYLGYTQMLYCSTIVYSLRLVRIHSLLQVWSSQHNVPSNRPITQTNLEQFEVLSLIGVPSHSGIIGHWRWTDSWVQGGERPAHSCHQRGPGAQGEEW